MTSTERAQALVDDVVTIQSNPHYRLGDVFYQKGQRHEESTADVLSSDEFRGALLRQYLEANGGAQHRNYELLGALVEQYAANTPSLKPRQNEVAVHIRAGDMVGERRFLRTDFKHFIRHSGCTNCALVVAFSFQEFPAKNRWMFSDEKLEQNRVAVRALFQDLVESLPHVDLRVCSSSDIDQDFVRLVLAPRFVRDEGGFSDLVQELRTHRGMTVPCENPKDNTKSVVHSRSTRGDTDADLRAIAKEQRKSVREAHREAALKATVEEQRKRVREARREVDRMTQELNRLRGSTSWRITRPLRYLRRKIR